MPRQANSGGVSGADKARDRIARQNEVISQRRQDRAAKKAVRLLHAKSEKCVLCNEEVAPNAQYAHLQKAHKADANQLRKRKPSTFFTTSGKVQDEGLLRRIQNSLLPPVC